MTQITYQLKYLFIAEFDDGSTIEQTLEDKSAIDPEKRSQFYDVLEAIKQGKKLVYFYLKSDTDTYGLDLETAAFLHNGKVFIVGDELNTQNPLEIIYYRRVRHNFNAQNREHISSEIAYFLGFQTNGLNGENIERKVGFD